MTAPEPVIGEIYATRTFGVTSQGLLTGLHEHSYVWSERENVATCQRRLKSFRSGPAHSAPDPSCRCGFYGYTVAAEQAAEHQIRGVVACYGTTLEGDLGVRSNKAQIVALYFGRRVPWSVKDEVEANYPSVQVFKDRASMLSEYDLAVDEVPNPGTFTGFRQARTSRLSRYRSMTGASSPDWSTLGTLVKACIVIGLSLGLLATSIPAVTWLASSVNSSFLAWFHGVGSMPEGLVWMRALVQPQTWAPWVLTMIYVAGMSTRTAPVISSMLVAACGPILGALPWALVAAPDGAWNSWHAAPGLFTAVSLLWLVYVALAVTMLVQTSIGRGVQEQRRLGRSHFQRIGHHLAQDFGVFAYVAGHHSPTKSSS